MINHSRYICYSFAAVFFVFFLVCHVWVCVHVLIFFRSFYGFLSVFGVSCVQFCSRVPLHACAQKDWHMLQVLPCMRIHMHAHTHTHTHTHTDIDTYTGSWAVSYLRHCAQDSAIVLSSPWCTACAVLEPADFVTILGSYSASFGDADIVCTVALLCLPSGLCVCACPLAFVCPVTSALCLVCVFFLLFIWIA